jgi:transcriptional regulator GlxA family with amidase domain
VDNNVDFYILFRIDALEGDKCTISWKKAKAPKEK